MKRISAGLPPQAIENQKSKIANPNSLSNTLGFWELKFNGRRAVLPQHQALFYVAWLFAHPFAPHLNGLRLATKVFERFGAHRDFSQATPWIACHRDDPLIAQILRNKQNALETIVGSPEELEPSKNEALLELSGIYDLQQTHFTQLAATAETTAKIIANGLLQLHNILATATDIQGDPHPVQRAFARHLLLYLLIPSIRSSGPGGMRHFTYCPEPALHWST